MADRKLRPTNAAAPTAAPTVAEDILRGLREAVDAVEQGMDPAARFSSTTYDIPAPSDWTADGIRKVRLRLGVPQSVFAKLVGVSAGLIGSWELGRKTPGPTAARLLDAIHDYPEVWADMLEGMITSTELREFTSWTTAERGGNDVAIR